MNGDIEPTVIASGSQLARSEDAKVKRGGAVDVLARVAKVQEFRLVVITLVVMGFISMQSAAFLTTSNFRNVGLEFSFIAVATLGLLFVIVVGGIDLSIGANIGLSGMVAASLMTHGIPVVVAILAALAVGAAIGAFNGALNTVFGVSSFIATLASLQIVRGITIGFTEGASVSGLPTWFLGIGNDTVLGFLPVPLLIAAALAVAVAFVMRRTPAGREFYAIGGSRQTAFLAGVAVRRRVMAAFILGGVFAALAGVLITARLGSAVPNTGTGTELTVIAAAVIGGASLAGGTGTVSGVLLGAFLLTLVNNGLILLSVPTYWQQAFVGAVIAIAVIVDRLQRGGGSA